jgi:hypothetical protein
MSNRQRFAQTLPNYREQKLITTKMKFEIKNRWNGEIIFSVEADNWRFAVEAAIKAKADLSFANLRSANLRSADLSFANLRSADLSSADLSFANLRSADLSSANLIDVRNDFWSILLFAQPEIAGLREAIVKGKIDGTLYEGDCACLIGTIAKVKKCNYKEFTGNLEANSDRAAERFFMGIKAGDTPENNPVSKIALEWLDVFVAQKN